MEKMLSVQDLNTFRQRQSRGKIATLPVLVCGAFVLHTSPPASEVRRVALCASRVSHDSLIIHARALSLLGYSYYTIRGVLLEAIVPGYSSRQLRI